MEPAVATEASVVDAKDGLKGTECGACPYWLREDNGQRPAEDEVKEVKWWEDVVEKK